MITSTGMRIGERYLLAEKIAIGGMGEVWRGLDEVLGREVAVKILRREFASDPPFRQRFRAEARTAAGLSHGGIAAVYDYGEAMDTAYLVMELVPGQPLSQLLTREGALGSELTLDVIAQAARALHAAHRRGVVHRDIKPANLMITPDLRVKVTDFGIARPRDHEPLTATGQVMGTAHYLAPELARGATASPLSDVYALGVVMYECLVGWRPFDGDNQIAVATAHLQQPPPPLPETIPAEVRRVVGTALAKDPADRPPGADAFASAVEWLRRRPTTVTAGATLPAQPGRAAATPSPAAAGTETQPAKPPARYRDDGPSTAVLEAFGGEDPPARGLRRRWRRASLPLVGLIALVGLVVTGTLAGGPDSRGDDPAPAAPRTAELPTAAVPTTAVSPAAAAPAAEAGTAVARRSARGVGDGRSMQRPVQVVERDYLGRPVKRVRAALRELDLLVTVLRRPADAARDTVLGIEPRGQLVPGSTVIVVVSDGNRGRG